MSDKPPIDPRTGQNLEFAPRYTAGVDVSKTLETDRSRERAKVILDAQPANNLSETALNQMYVQALEKIAQLRLPAREAAKARMDAWEQLLAPTHYVIPYYMPTKAGDSISPKLIKTFSDSNGDTIETPLPNGEKGKKNVPYIRAKSDFEPEGNPVIALNENMVRAVHESFATIQAQLPGRFQFVRVDTPEKALINFAAVPRATNIRGVASADLSCVLFNSRSYAGTYNAAHAYVALHEIGHALGLEHPQSYAKQPGGPSTDKATYLDSVMTYGANNDAQSDRSRRAPVSLMRADATTLKWLYKIRADALSQKASIASPTLLAKEAPDFKAILEGQGGNVLVPFAEQGLIYAPDVPSGPITLRIEQPPLVQNPSASARSRLVISSSVAGTVLMRSAGAAETLIPVRPNRILLSPGPEEVEITGDMHVVSPRNRLGQGPDIFSISGKNNHLSFSVADMVFEQTRVKFKPGSETTVQLRDVGALHYITKYAWENILVGDYTDQPKKPQMTMQWQDKGDGKFQVSLRDAASPTTPPVSVKFVLEKPTPADITEFRKALQQPVRASYTIDMPMKDRDGIAFIFKTTGLTSERTTPMEITQQSVAQGHGVVPKKPGEEKAR